MSVSLYLVVVDGNGTPIQGSSVVDKLSNPLRDNKPVARPFELTGYSFGAEAPVAGTGGGGVGKVDPGELVVEMTDDLAAAVLFRAIATGKTFRSVDVLVRVNGERPVVVSGVGVASARLTAISWGGTTAGISRRLQVDGEVFTVGSIGAQHPDGTYDPFTLTRYNTVSGTVG